MPFAKIEISFRTPADFVKNVEAQRFPKYEFHIARQIREKYDFEEELFSITGNVILADFRAVRNFTEKINRKRGNEYKVRAGQVNATGLLDEIYHFIIREYEATHNPGVFSRIVNYLEKKLTKKRFRFIVSEFVDLFPPSEVYKNKMSVADYIASSTEGKPNIEIIIEEMALLYFANLNPANAGLKELFDDTYFGNRLIYAKSVMNMEEMFKNEKPFGPENQDLFTLLRAPILHSPEDIEGQLDFIQKKWGIILKDKFTKRILTSRDLIKEDRRFDGFGGGKAPTVVPKYRGLHDDLLSLGKSGYNYAADSSLDYLEPEQFTPDIHWMPNVVMIAKNAYVWLDQLSKKYGWHIHKLDHVPDEELDEIAGMHINGLWLIGLWERSVASRRIKQIMGNPDAISSAYSLWDYEVAYDLGGEAAFQNLKERAWKRGIRLASDMVPNHTGIYSRWVLEKPHYFIQSNYSPFPNYSFTGVDLSENSDMQVRIEDGYWRHSDASVVFQRIDNRTGEVKYIYHGNDGTNMPWNDTAQLNMLIPEVREAVIQKIFEVARKTSIIRFDAAMTLAKKHFQRLWYPQPGTGGDIPSRSDHALTRQEFDNWFPKEFWREVVDRINEELPETLLLAEAFWLMEGYFVRTLGMHRVYNSAFMHMIMNEENRKYRDLITNTLEFEPEILKRYVNFMSNPDEETAIKQFGTDDKYFGTFILMITLPGLPMIAHGQIEGYTEKYGMEYRRAYYNESPNQWLIDRHRREIFPVLKKRYLFSEVYNFWFFDFHDNAGYINENVMAYSNGYGHERALIFYNNKYDSAFGRIYHSAPKLVPGENDKYLKHITIGEALSIKNDGKYFYIFRESISGLEFIKAGNEFYNDGFYIELQGFKYKVFMDFREVYDHTGEFEAVRNRLFGGGAANIWLLVEEERLKHIHEAMENLADEKIIDIFVNAFVLDDVKKEKAEKDLKFILNRYSYLLGCINDKYRLNVNCSKELKDFSLYLSAVRNVNIKLGGFLREKKYSFNKIIGKKVPFSTDSNYLEHSYFYLAWLTVKSLKNIMPLTGELNKENFFNKIILEKPLHKIFHKTGMGDREYNKEMFLLLTLLKYGGGILSLKNLPEGSNSEEKYAEKMTIIADMLEDKDVKNLLGVNVYKEITYYSKENFEEMMNWLLSTSFVEYFADEQFIKENTADEINNSLIRSMKLFSVILELSDNSGYQLPVFKESLKFKFR